MRFGADLNAYDAAWHPLLIWERRGQTYLTFDKGRQGLEDEPCRATVAQAHAYFGMRYDPPSPWERVLRVTGLMLLVTWWARRRGKRIAQVQLAKYVKVTAARHQREAVAREMMMKQQYQEQRVRAMTGAYRGGRKQQ